MLDLQTETARIADMLDRFAARNPGLMRTCACDNPEDGGAVPEMQAGPVDGDGWVVWRILPSRVSLSDLEELEREVDVSIPTALRAYLLARTHLFDQVHSAAHDQQIFLSDNPFQDPLRPIRQLIEGFIPLLRAGYLPFAQWGDGWGPMCIDTRSPSSSAEDGPVVWFDHEILCSIGEQASSDRATVSLHANLLYQSFHAFLGDVFDVAPPA